MGRGAAARTVAKPFRFIKVPVLWGVWHSVGRRWVVHLAKNGIPGQPLRGCPGIAKSGCWQPTEAAHPVLKTLPKQGVPRSSGSRREPFG